MVKRFFVFIFVIAFAAVILAYGCGDKSGKGGKGGVEPVSNNRIVWAQEVPPGFVLPTPSESSAKSSSKDASLGQKNVVGGLMQGPPEQPEAGKANFVRIFSSRYDGSDLKIMTPDISAVSLSRNAAPNGDIWFWTDIGIFKVNLGEETPKPVLLMDRQRFVTSFFSDGDEAGLYYPPDLLTAIVGKWASSFSINFVRLNEAGDYNAIINLNIDGIKSATGQKSGARLVLKCDSNMTSCEKVFPFATSLEKSSGVADFADGAKRGVVNFYFGYFQSKPGKYYYALAQSDAEMNGVFGNNRRVFNAEYNPLDGRHRTALFPSADWQMVGHYISEDCVIFQKPVDMPFKVSDCSIRVGGAWNDDVLNGVKADVAKCMDDKVAAAKVELACVPYTDVTDYLSSEDKLKELFGLNPPPAKFSTGISGLDLVKFNKDKDVSCSPNVGTCAPLSTIVYPNECPADNCRQKNTLYINPETWSSEYTMDYIAFLAKDGPYRLFKLVNIKDGSIKTIDSDTQDIVIYPGSAFVPVVDNGSVVLYQKERVSDGFLSFFIFDPAWEKPAQITDFVENLGSVSFGCRLANGEDAVCRSVVPDKSAAFFKTIDPNALWNANWPGNVLGEDTYIVDMSALFPVAAEDAAKDKGQSGADKAVSAKAGALGDKSKLAHPEKKGEIGYVLIGVDRDAGKWRALWSVWRGQLWRLFTNFPQDEDTSVKGIIPNIIYESDEEFLTVAAVEKYSPAEGVGLDISADLVTMMGCGGSGSNATYCKNYQEMCYSGKCENMFMCSPSVSHGVCEDVNQVCDNGQCVAAAPLPPGPLPPPGGGCAGHSECLRFEKCANGVCVNVPGEECQVVEQCRAGGMQNVADAFTCDAGQHVCVPNVRNLVFASEGVPRFVRTWGLFSENKEYTFDLVARWSAATSNNPAFYFDCGLFKGGQDPIETTHALCQNGNCDCRFDRTSVVFTVPLVPDGRVAPVTYTVKVWPSFNVIGRLAPAEASVTLQRP